MNISWSDLNNVQEAGDYSFRDGTITVTFARESGLMRGFTFMMIVWLSTLDVAHAQVVPLGSTTSGTAVSSASATLAQQAPTQRA